MLAFAHCPHIPGIISADFERAPKYTKVLPQTCPDRAAHMSVYSDVRKQRIKSADLSVERNCSDAKRESAHTIMQHTF